jgi:hypothetical protein
MTAGTAASFLFRFINDLPASRSDFCSTPKTGHRDHVGRVSFVPIAEVPAAEIAELSGGAATKPHHLVSERKAMWTTE